MVRTARKLRVKRWQQRFLRSLRTSPNIALACERARISRQTAYRTRAADSAFALAWQEALEASLDELEGKAFELAKRGSEQLLTWLLRCHRPDTYRETTRTEVGIVAKIVLMPPKEVRDA